MIEGYWIDFLHYIYEVIFISIFYIVYVVYVVYSCLRASNLAYPVDVKLDTDWLLVILVYSLGKLLR